MEEGKILLLEQQLKNYKESADKEINELRRITQEQDKRITQLELNNTKIDLQYEQIMVILNKLNERTVPNLIEQIEGLKNRPAKRYEQAVSSLIGAIFGAVGGVIVSLLFNKGV